MIAIRKITVIAGLLIIAGLVSRAGAAGTTITVTSLNDSAQGCTLSDALIVANKGGGSSNGCSAGADTAYIIQFENGLSGSITLPAMSRLWVPPPRQE